MVEVIIKLMVASGEWDETLTSKFLWGGDKLVKSWKTYRNNQNELQFKIYD